MAGALVQAQGGCNCANALTAMARLGGECHLVTKIGDDALAGQILDELHADNIHTDHVLQAQDHASPFTYVIVDRQGAGSALPAWARHHVVCLTCQQLPA